MKRWLFLLLLIPALCFAGPFSNYYRRGTISFWFRVTTWGADFNLFYAWLNNSNAIRIRLLTSDEIQFTILDGGSDPELESTTFNGSTGQWYFLRAQYDEINNTMSLKVWDTTPTLQVDLSGSDAIANIDLASSSLFIGDTSGNSADVHIDHVLIFNADDVNAEDYKDCTTYSSCSW
jgi:hypothetical protein